MKGLILKDHSEYCGSYPCDGGNDCWINCQPIEKQCKKCLCSSCILGTCAGGKPTREHLREIERKTLKIMEVER